MFRVTVLAFVGGILWWETFSISLPLPLLAKNYETVCYNKATFINRIYKTKTLTNREISAKWTKRWDWPRNQKSVRSFILNKHWRLHYYPCIHKQRKLFIVWSLVYPKHFLFLYRLLILRVWENMFYPSINKYAPINMSVLIEHR